MKYIKAFFNGFIEGWIWIYTIPFAAYGLGCLVRGE